MKRFFMIWGLSMVLLSGCGTAATGSLATESSMVELSKEESSQMDETVLRVEKLTDWSFQYNEGTNDYSIFFGLTDKNDRPLATNIDIDIRIVNDENEEVYAGTKSVYAEDYGYYTSEMAGERYLANVKIPAKELIAGKSPDGTVYFRVYKGDVVEFDEVNCSVFHCLPVKDIQVNFDSFPLDLHVKDYMGDTTSVIQIQEVEYKFQKDYTPKLTITIIGEKKSGSNAGYDMISYKLYDGEGYLIKSGDIYLSDLSEGDKFKNNSVVIYDIIPGESYTFQLSEYNW